jgi:Conserved protein containing a Zn-ribbon-like motif, possibly RNA-binding
MPDPRPQLLLGVDVQPSALFAVALINSRPERGGEEGLRSAADLAAIGEQSFVFYVPDRTEAEIVALRRLRTQLDDIVTASSMQERFDIINELFRAASAIPHIVMHEPDPYPHFHYTMDDAAYSDQVKGITAYAMGRLIIMDEFRRLKTCEGNACNRLFLDTTRNSIRRYCDSRTCGNRIHSARYRSRRAG